MNKTWKHLQAEFDVNALKIRHRQCGYRMHIGSHTIEDYERMFAIKNALIKAYEKLVNQLQNYIKNNMED